MKARESERYDIVKAEYNALRGLKGLEELSDDELEKDNKFLNKIFPEPHNVFKRAIESSKGQKKMNTRIETYIHSDSIDKNKGGVMVRVSCQSDAASKTSEFIEFCGDVARLSYAVLALKEGDPTRILKSGDEISKLIEDVDVLTSGNFANNKMELEKALREKIKVEEVVLMTTQSVGE